MVLGLLLARAGVGVTVLEKHADFLRDFRGDTVHASTLTLLDELGLGERFAAIPHRLLDIRIQVELDAGTAQLVDLRRLPGRHQHIALVPQWDLLELIAEAADAEPTFQLVRDAEVTGLLREGDRVAGVRWLDRTSGAQHELGPWSPLRVTDGTRRSAPRRESRRARSVCRSTCGGSVFLAWPRIPRVASRGSLRASSAS